MQRGVAEVVRREDFEFVALFVDDPDKGAERGDGEDGEDKKETKKKKTKSEKPSMYEEAEGN